MTSNPGFSTPAWPDTLRRGAVRWSFRSQHYDATVAFYRDLVRLPVLTEFSSSFGEDGTILGLPGTSIHLEILRSRAGDPAADGHTEIVLYLDGEEVVAAATAMLRDAGVAPDAGGHPYWEANGALTYRDPDGRSLLFAPWVFGEVPDPVDRPTDPDAADRDPAGSERTDLRVDWYDGDRHELRQLFEEAEDSPAQLESYLDLGRVLVARIGTEVVGYLQLVDEPRPHEVELKSMAVADFRRGTGIGTGLVERAISTCRAAGYRRMSVATASADIDNLRFYQRRGFRVSGVEQDAFTADTGYPENITIDGIRLRDRVWFTQVL